MKRTIATMALVAVAGAANAATINFEDRALNDVVSTQYSGLGVTFSSGGLTGNFNTIFSGGTTWNGTAATATNMQVHNTDVGGGSNGTKVLHTFNGWLSETGDPVFTMNFTNNVSTISMDFVGISAAASVIAAYNGSTLINFVKGNSSPGIQRLTLVPSSATTKIIVVPGSFGDWQGVDNIDFTLVPAPGAAALLGLGGLVAGRRRR
ncbi:MAG: hypothetical protein JNM07_13360 [Phycisphaerae bacterium]|nr:hypothetical protein [Phycisphaerae bacterium]